MAAGDLHIRRNALETTVLPNAGSNLDVTWDTEVTNQGGSIDYSAGNFQLDIGIYLVMYSEKFDTTDVTNNERIEVQGEIHESGVGVVGGYGQDFIRKSSGQQECIISGSMILEVTSNNTDYFIRFYRTDNSTSGTVNRVPGTGGLQILQLDSAHNFGLYSTGASEATSGTAIRTLNLSINDRQDTGFSRTGDVITVSNAGRYVMTYSLDISQAATGREDIVGFIERNSTTPVVGSYGYCYLRGADGTQDGAITWVGIVDVAANDTFRVRWSVPTNATVTAAAGGTLQMWQLPVAADSAIMEATTGNYNAAGDFTFDTLPHIDIDSFTATAAASNIDLDQPDYALSFATFSQAAPDSVQRGYPEVRLRLDNTNINYAGAGVYHRNSGGSGIVAVNVAGIIESPNPTGSIEVNITPEGAGGTMNNDSAQFGVISLVSIFGSYTFPPAVSTFNDFQWGQVNRVITGANFGALQGTGKVEIWSDQVGTIKTVQTIDSWSDTSIQIDTVRGSLPDDINVYLVVTIDGGQESTPFIVSVGVPGQDTVIAALAPDHAWSFNNTFADTGFQDTRDAFITAGSPTFAAVPLSRGRTHSLRINAQSQRVEFANSNWTNAQTETARTMGGKIMISQVQDSFVCFYEEGGGVNNLAFFMGMGGILIAQFADTGDDNVHAYSDFKLAPNRVYDIRFRFDYNGRGLFESFVDGVLMSSTFGNPFTSTDLDAHSGDPGWGDASGTLEVFGTDILFPAAVISYYQDWDTYTREVTDTELRVELFEKSVIPEYIISSGTQAAMQAQVSVYENTIQGNHSCTFKIEGCTDGDFSLEFPNITFDAFTSIQIQYTGNDILSAKNLNGSNLIDSKISTPYGGTVNIIEAIDTTITGIPTGAEYRLYVNDPTPGVIGTVELLGAESKADANDLIYSDEYTADTDVSLQVLADGFEEFNLDFTLLSTPQEIIVELDIELNA